MRLLLDESVPRRLRDHLEGHEVSTRLQDYVPLAPRLLEALKKAKAGHAVEVAA